MKRIFTILLTSVLIFSMCTPVLATQEEKDIDVTINYISEITGEYTAPITNGTATVDADSVSISVSGATSETMTLVVVPIPKSETEAWNWFSECIKENETIISIYDIYFLDKNQNRISAENVSVTMDCPALEGELSVCSVTTKGDTKELSVVLTDNANANNASQENTDKNQTNTNENSTIQDNRSKKMIFTANGSHYYVLTEKQSANEPDNEPNDKPNTTPITVPVSGEENMVHAEAVVEGNIATLEELDDAEIDHVVGSHVETGIVEIDFTKLGTQIVGVVFPVGMVEHIVLAAQEAHNDTEALAIHLSTGTIQLDDKTMRTLVEQAEYNEVRLMLESVGTKRLNEKQKSAFLDKTIYGGYEAYMLCVASNQRISDFEGGIATLSVPFDVPKGMKPEKFAIWYISDNGEIEELETWYENDRLCWSVSHFSDFIITYDDAEIDNTEDKKPSTKPEDVISPPTGDVTQVWTWLLLILAGNVCFGLAGVRKKQQTEI